MGEQQRYYRGDKSAATVLDEKGRCCGRKPLDYKRENHKFCDRCDRAYDRYNGTQRDNWAWKRQADGQFIYSAGSKRIGS